MVHINDKKIVLFKVQMISSEFLMEKFSIPSSSLSLGMKNPSDNIPATKSKSPTEVPYIC